MYIQECRLAKRLEMKTGTKKDGTSWASQQIVLEWNLNENAVRRMVVSCWSNDLELFEGIEPGDPLKIQFIVQSREWEGKWFTEVKPIRVKSLKQVAPPPPVQTAPPPAAPTTASNSLTPQPDDLPF